MWYSSVGLSVTCCMLFLTQVLMTHLGNNTVISPRVSLIGYCMSEVTRLAKEPPGVPGVNANLR